MKKNYIIIGLVLIMMVGLYLWWTGSRSSGSEQVLCAADVQLCPDGTYVSRVAPSCQFAACPEVNNNPAGGTVRADVDVTMPLVGAKVQSPFQIKGEAKGTWFFEASFPIKLYDAKGKLLGTAIAAAQSDWMTTDYVPFVATMTFTKPGTSTGKLVFEKDNPSGLPENAGQMEIPVTF